MRLPENPIQRENRKDVHRGGQWKSRSIQAVLLTTLLSVLGCTDQKTDQKVIAVVDGEIYRLGTEARVIVTAINSGLIKMEGDRVVLFSSEGHIQRTGIVQNGVVSWDCDVASSIYPAIHAFNVLSKREIEVLCEADNSLTLNSAEK